MPKEVFPVSLTLSIDPTTKKDEPNLNSNTTLSGRSNDKRNREHLVVVIDSGWRFVLFQTGKKSKLLGGKMEKQRNSRNGREVVEPSHFPGELTRFFFAEPKKPLSDHPRFFTTLPPQTQTLTNPPCPLQSHTLPEEYKKSLPTSVWTLLATALLGQRATTCLNGSPPLWGQEVPRTLVASSSWILHSLRTTLLSHQKLFFERESTTATSMPRGTSAWTSSKITGVPR